jgi:hypothetical protein
MIKRLPVALLVLFLSLLGLQSVLVTPAYASMSRAFKNAPSLTDNLNFSLPLTGENDILQASVNKALLMGDGIFAGSLNASRLLISSSTLLDKKSPDEVAISLAGTGQVNLADPIIISGILRDLSTGAGIPNKSITISTYGVYLGQTHTDDQGDFTVKINRDLPAGKYLMTAFFKGAHLLAPAFAVVSVEVLPAIVRVDTVPATAGVTFQMDGRQFVSGSDGSASITINQSGVYRLDLLLDQYHNPSQKVEFGRWSEESYQPFRDVVVPTNSPVQVGLNVFHKVSLKFVDLDGFPVDPSRITAISIRSIQGDAFTLKPGDTPWLPASRTAHRQIGLEETKLLYSVNSVTIDGSNTVNSAQQRFFAQIDSSWTISLLLYSLHVTSRDGVFAAPVGTSIDVVFPNGQVKNYPLDKSGALEIHALARGIYHISLIGTKGLGTSTPVALSRNQVVNLNIVTPLDLAAFGLVSIGLGLGLIIYGRPWLLRYLLKRKRPSSSKMGWTSLHEN